MNTALDHLRAAGFTIDGEIITDGEFHRCQFGGDKPDKSTGSYRVIDGKVYAHTWRNADEWKVVRLDEQGAAPSNDTERERARVLRAQEAEANRIEGAKGAREIWERATPSDGSHRYLTKKRIQPHVARRSGGELLIPLSDVDGTLWNFQRIKEDGTKLFPKDGRVRGCFCIIGNLDGASRALVAEGYATAATLHEATGLPAVVAVDCGNLEHVVDALVKKHVQVEFLICADDDRHTKDNPGVSHALDVAKKHRLRIAIPTGFNEASTGTDYNDLAAERGVDEVKRQVETAWNTPPHKFTLAEVVPDLAKLSLEQLAEQGEKWAGYFKLTPTEIKRQASKHRDESAVATVTAKVAAAIEPWPTEPRCWMNSGPPAGGSLCFPHKLMFCSPSG